MFGSVKTFTLMAVMMVCAVNAGVSPVEKCTQTKHLSAAQGLCQSHGVNDKSMACVCTEAMPICVQSDLDQTKKPENCSPALHEACVGSCASGVLAVKCAGTSASTCMSIDPAVKQKLAQLDF
ncbi:predicted protein [Lichtheimia corymbifera JMRC:FSU:9682]|uniref:Extracellular membrane protein CFEM domain-containing protein n=1 Tax=Lichtheimia corymbifera JMRC:FSU:9682 TaxID=1263082 RepID=A0A068RZY3_9FUNG|nr:predicted protein [Lichtheimia corymbifera JMRC:FSU:9682]